MNRFDEIVSFIEYDHKNNMVIEPEKRWSKIRDHLLDLLTTYKPKVIIKAGLGSGRLLIDIAQNTTAYIAVVEPSMTIIVDFLTTNKNEPCMEKIHIINGDFNSFPIDYFAADMLISIDYLDFLESGKVVDEFQRALQFDGILFLAGIVLNDDDIDGLYDDFMKEAFPLHNDYYLREDLKTFLDLNDFSFIKGTIEHYDSDLVALVNYFKELYKDTSTDPMKQIENHREEFVNLYKLSENVISEPYYIGLFMRRKPEAIK